MFTVPSYLNEPGTMPDRVFHFPVGSCDFSLWTIRLVSFLGDAGNQHHYSIRNWLSQGGLEGLDLLSNRDFAATLTECFGFQGWT